MPVYLSSGSEYLGVIEGTVNQVNGLFNSMVGVVVGAAILAIINALIISVIERRTELGIMRALGTSKRQLRNMVAIEAACLGVMGGVIGVAFGLLSHRAAMVAVGHQGGMPVMYSFLSCAGAARVPARDPDGDNRGPGAGTASGNDQRGGGDRL